MPLCDICGSTAIQELKCKVICRNCGTILQSCADLESADPCGAIGKSHEAAD